MLKRTTYWAGWSAVSAAVLGAMIAFPQIASTAESQHETAEWTEKAADFLMAQNTAAMNVAISYAAEPIEAPEYRAILDQAAFDAAEQKCLAEAVYYEARSETRAGQKAVAEVVLNRVASKHFPDTVCGVVYEGSERSTGCQFSFTCDGSMDIAPKGKSWDRSQAIASVVLTSGVSPMTNRATHYHTTAIKPVWSDNLRMTKRVGSHVFYRFAPRDYSPSMPTMVTVAPPS